MEYRYKDTSNTVYYSDEYLADNPSIVGYVYSRIGFQISTVPLFYQTSLFKYESSIYTPYWSVLVHPKIRQIIAAFDPTLDQDLIVRLNYAVRPDYLNNYAAYNDNRWLPYQIYYARKNWTTVEWSTDAPVQVPYSYLLTGGATYISNIENLSGPYYPKYLSPDNSVQTLPDVAVPVGKKILLKNQTNPSENGVYLVNAGAWTKILPIKYPSMIYLNGYGYTFNQSSGFGYNYVYSATGTTSYYAQLSETTFSVRNYSGTITNASIGFYLYPTLNDALNDTNQITFTYEQSWDSLNDSSFPANQFYIDENSIQHWSRPQQFQYYMLFSPIDYNYQLFQLKKGVGCCYVHPDIVSSDIPDNMSFSYMGQSVSLKRGSLYYPEAITKTEYDDYNASHYPPQFYNEPPNTPRYGYFFKNGTYKKYDFFKALSQGSNWEYDYSFSNYFFNYASGSNFIVNNTGAGAMFVGDGIHIKMPSDYWDRPFLNSLQYIKRHVTYTTTGEGTESSPLVVTDLTGRMAYFYALDLNTIMVNIFITVNGYYADPNIPTFQNYNLISDGIWFTNYSVNSYNGGALINQATFVNTTPNSTSRSATFAINSSGWSYPTDATKNNYPSSFVVNRGGNFTLPNQLRLNMPNSFFANRYVGIDTASSVKGTTKVVQDPISVGNINVVLTLDKNDGIYYSSPVTLNGIKGQFAIKTNAYNLNTGNWLNDHTITKEFFAGNIYSTFGLPFGDIKPWSQSGYNSNHIYSFNVASGNTLLGEEAFYILGKPYLKDETGTSYYVNKNYYYADILPRWYVANDDYGGYATGLPQGTIWMDTRVHTNINTLSGAHTNPNPDMTSWCAVWFSEWQNLRSPATSKEMYYNTLGPKNLITVPTRDIFNNQIAWELVEGGPLWNPSTDFYNRNHYYVQSNSPHCWLSSLSV